MRLPKTTSKTLAARAFGSFGWLDAKSDVPTYTQPHDADIQNVARELRGIVGVLTAGRRKLLVNNFLRVWSGLWNWILIALVIATLFVVRLSTAAFASAILILAGGVAIMGWTWWTRPSRFYVARLLDSSAALHDRISTALYFGNSTGSDRMIQYQRQDAVEKFNLLDRRALFPIKAPAALRRTLALLVTLAVAFTYRAYYRPPLTALLETTAMSRLVQSVLKPLKKNAEESLQRPESAEPANTEKANESRRPAESMQTTEEPWIPEKGPVSRDNVRPAGTGDASDDPSLKEGAKPSMSQALLAALKGMMGSQTAAAAGKRQPRTATDPQGTPNQADPGSGGDQREFQEGPDSLQKNPQGTANGAGDQQAGSKELKKSAPLTFKSVPDRVPLQATNLKDQPRMNIDGEAGTSKIATGNASARTTGLANGAEQENIPARYRSYLQRYFQHDDVGTH